MVDHGELLAAQCDNWTEDERDVMDILLNLPEMIANLRINYGQDQLVPWGWKKRRSAVNSPLTPFPSPADSPLSSPSSSPPRRSKFKPRVAHTKEQFLQEINALTQRKKVDQQEQLLEEINELTQRGKVHQQELLKVQSHLVRQIQFNNRLKELTAGATTLASNQISL